MSAASPDHVRLTQVTDDIWVYDDAPISAAGISNAGSVDCLGNGILTASTSDELIAAE